MLLLATFSLLLANGLAAPLDHPDRVINLPGAPIAPSFLMYSGFLNAEDNGSELKLFYVLCEAIHADPATAPLLIWLNGGPGSSSLFGLMMIHGPFLLNAEGQLRYNDFSWNQYANVLYLETPSGVGFSRETTDDGDLIMNDNSTASINAKALQDFMTRVHPRYSNRDFYITGESYAGVYIPYFAREVLEHVKSGEFTNPNLKGIAMGNAAVDYFSDEIASSLQLYSLGMIPEKFGTELFDKWERITEGKKPGKLSDELREQLNTVHNTIGNRAHYDLPLLCNAPDDDTIWHIAKAVPNAECNPSDVIEAYFNRPDVQYRLNVRKLQQHPINWRMSNKYVSFIYEIDSDTIHLYKDILALTQGDFRILFYTGDMDLVCPPLQVAFGARRIAEDNAMTTISTPAWTYLSDYGGARTSYLTSDGRVSIDVLTVRGASHMVPMTHPDRAFQLINNFISAEAKATIEYSKTIPRKI